MTDEEPPGGRLEPPAPPIYFDYPAWHPGGEWIAATHGDSVDTDKDGQDDDYFGGIWLVHAETGSTQPLIRGFESPAWSPDGTQLAIEARGHIFTINVTSLKPASVDTTSLLQLTTEGANFFPDWSPDGEWIVYDSNLGNQSPGYYDLWIIRHDGSSKRRLEANLVGSRIPNWSPDSKYIVHERTVISGTGAPEIFTVDTSGYNPVRLTFAEQEADMNPRYSPNGTRIAWIAHREKSLRNWAMNVWIMNSDGSYPWKLTRDHAWIFDWSPDGRQIVFLFWATTIDDIPPGNGELWLINVNGTGLRQLTHSKK